MGVGIAGQVESASEWARLAEPEHCRDGGEAERGGLMSHHSCSGVEGRAGGSGGHVAVLSGRARVAVGGGSAGRHD